MWHRYGIFGYFRSHFEFFSLVTIFDELFRSENVKQVYSIVTDWMSSLDESERLKIK